MSRMHINIIGCAQFTVLISAEESLTVRKFQEAYEDNVCQNDPVKVVLDLPITELVVVSG